MDPTDDGFRGPLPLHGHSSGPIVGILFSFQETSADSLAEALKRISPNIRLEAIVSDQNTTITEAERAALQSCEILVAAPWLVDKFNLTYDLPNLKWMHSLSAGVDKIVKRVKHNEIPRYILTRNSGYFDLQMAEYVIGMVLMRELQFEQYAAHQKQKLWKKECRRSLSTLSLGIIGFGSIGKEVARVAKEFGMTVWALVRTMPLTEEKCPAVDEFRPLPDLNDLLSSCDYIVSVLPSTSNTNGFFDGEVLSVCKEKKPIFINIGRGNVISNSTVTTALDEGWLSHAILDVFEKEPLEPESGLWTHPQVTITAHTSGSQVRVESFLEMFVQNYERYINGEKLKSPVDWNKGY